MEKFIRSFDGVKVCYWHERKENPLTLVFLHGVGGNWTVWKKEIEFFQKKGYSTLTLDLRGHGQSDAPIPFHHYGLPCFSRDIYTILRQEKIDNFALVGHSLGGAVSINYCMRYKHLFPKSLILVESASKYPFEHDHILNYSPYVTHLLRFLADHAPLRKRHFPHLDDVDLSERSILARFKFIRYLLHLTPIRSIVETLDNVERFVFHNKDRIDATLQHLTIPTLLIAGDHDTTVPPEFSKYIKRLNKNAQLRILRGAGHRVTVEKPEQVCSILYKFVQHKLHTVPVLQTR